MAKEKAKKKVKPIDKKKTAETYDIDFLELENRVECLERALAEGLDNIAECMKHVIEMNPKIKKCAERLGIES